MKASVSRPQPTIQTPATIVASVNMPRAGRPF